MLMNGDRSVEFLLRALNPTPTPSPTPTKGSVIVGVPTATPTPVPPEESTPTPTPTLAPPGGRILFMSYRDNNVGTIYVINGDGTGETLHSSVNLPQSAVWSPDGSMIAQNAIFLDIMNADGSNLVTITDYSVADIAWSPDGSKIAMARFRSGTGSTWP